jgi:hypothetical protein
MAVPRHDGWRGRLTRHNTWWGTPFHVAEPRQHAPRATGYLSPAPRRHAWQGIVHLPRHAWWRAQFRIRSKISFKFRLKWRPRARGHASTAPSPCTRRRAPACTPQIHPAAAAGAATWRNSAGAEPTGTASRRVRGLRQARRTGRSQWRN